MKLQLSDDSSTNVEIYSIAETYLAGQERSTINIDIRHPQQDLDYYKGLFVNSAVATMVAKNEYNANIATFHGEQVISISHSVQDDMSFISIQIEAA